MEKQLESQAATESEPKSAEDKSKPRRAKPKAAGRVARGKGRAKSAEAGEGGNGAADNGDATPRPEDRPQKPDKDAKAVKEEPASAGEGTTQPSDASKPVK